jgi:proteasome assembly chaperone (PAC2) family protein
MSSLSYLSRPALKSPVMLVGFGGWSDAGNAATSAVRHLKDQWGSKTFANIDPEDFYDFQQYRPLVFVNDAGIREITWPGMEFDHATMGIGGRDIVLFEALEPSLRWRTFTDHVLDVAKESGAELVVGLGALLAGRPHTRPIRVTGSAATPEIAQQFGLQMPRYEGPTGILGVIMDACRRSDLPVVTLWGWVPHYLQGAPSPTATIALLQRLGALLGESIDLGDLEKQARTHEEEVTQAVRNDPEITATVEELERQADLHDQTEIPSGEELAAEFERYLRDQRN